MRRKNLNAVKLRDVIIKDKKINPIYKKLKSVLLKVKQNNSFAVAVSGGPDSVALAFLSNLILVSERKSRIYFLLVDHGIRKNSGKEALASQTIVKKRGINLQILKKNKKISSNIQKNARDLRYGLLVEFCKKKIKLNHC